jgi:hypothetical protein
MPNHRGIEYRVIQGVQPRTWTWEILLPDGTRTGQSKSKLEAVRAAERVIERALAPARKPLVAPRTPKPGPVR